MLALSGWWIVGWAVGFGGAVAAALLLVAIIATAKRIARQGGDIGEAIAGAWEHTTPLFDVTRTNLALDRITREVGRS